MKSFFSPNIGNKGRLVRGCGALVLLAGAGFGFTVSVWLGALLLGSGAFVLFESLRGWCALRACGIKTKL
ncbi:MAG TPA: YgaP-like transmembrane domain [Candidatus Acidoferrum sp.]|nr:YgaP-like transmembrane domain [Candidatus Acidoferrum sp.]